jgi:integrase
MKKKRGNYLYRKRVKGRDYLYFRAPNGKLTPLPLDQKSAAFRVAYAAALRSIKPRAVEPQIKAAHEGSINAAIDIFLDSPEFRGLKSVTKGNYQRGFDYMRDHIGPGALRTLDTDALDIYSADIAGKKHDLKRADGRVVKGYGGTSVADMHVSLISCMWRVCKKYPQFGLKGLPNPSDDAKQHYGKPRQPHRPWTAEAQDAFMEAAPPRLQLAKMLLHFSAQRGGDCVKMKWTHFDGAGLFVWPEKAGGDALQDANYHLCPKPLLDALNAAPRVGAFILVNANGAPYASTRVLSAAIRRVLDRVGLRPGGKRTFSMHGLRKNAASEVGQLLVGTAGIMSVTGHASKEMAEYYAKHAERIRMNRDVVEKWNADLARQEAERVKIEAVANRRASIKAVK